MNQKERKQILESIKDVDEVVLSSHPRNPKDTSVSADLLKIKPDSKESGAKRNERGRLLRLANGRKS